MENEIKEVKRFSDFVRKANFEGEKVDVESLVNTEFKIIDFELIASNKFKQGGRFAVVSAMLGDKKIVANFSEIIAGQLEGVGHENLPIIAKIAMKKSQAGQRYWCLE